MKNEICAATIVRRLWLFALLLACLVAYLLPTSVAGQDARAKYNVTGRWQGKFPVPEESNASDAENPVAVEVSVKEDAGKLSGTTVFYVVRSKDNKPQVVGRAESDLVDPQFDGTMLKFSVKSKGPQSGKETKIDMQMRLTSATEAELENLDDNSSPPFKMKKVQ
jgi:hypothetical protein